jgi:hypothetical protein
MAGVSAAKQPLLPAAAAVDPLNSPCCFLRPDEQLMLPHVLMNSYCCLLGLMKRILFLMSMIMI